MPKKTRETTRFSDITAEKIDGSKITAERPSKETYASMGTIYIGPERRKTPREEATTILQQK